MPFPDKSTPISAYRSFFGTCAFVQTESAPRPWLRLRWPRAAELHASGQPALAPGQPGAVRLRRGVLTVTVTVAEEEAAGGGVLVAGPEGGGTILLLPQPRRPTGQRQPALVLGQPRAARLRRFLGVAEGKAAGRERCYRRQRGGKTILLLPLPSSPAGQPGAAGLRRFLGVVEGEAAVGGSPAAAPWLGDGRAVVGLHLK